MNNRLLVGVTSGEVVKAARVFHAKVASHERGASGKGGATSSRAPISFVHVPSIDDTNVGTLLIENGSLYLSACRTILPPMKNWGLTDRRFHGLSQTEYQRGSSGPLTWKARTVARATEPAFRKAGHDRRLR